MLSLRGAQLRAATFARSIIEECGEGSACHGSLNLGRCLFLNVPHLLSIILPWICLCPLNPVMASPRHLLFSLFASAVCAQSSGYDFVNPFIGTKNGGDTHGRQMTMNSY